MRVLFEGARGNVMLKINFHWPNDNISNSNNSYNNNTNKYNNNSDGNTTITQTITKSS